MSTYRVLVFGSTGTGKTSLCNALTGQRMRADSSARGNTFETHTYQPFSSDSNTFHVTDTVGLNESEKGTVPATKAAIDLVELIHQAKDGFSILIHVFKIPRKTNAHDENYDFFVNKMTQGSIPVLLVATGCENEHPMSAWAEKNHEHFAKDGCEYKEIISACFAAGGPLEATYAPLRAESRQRLLAAITQHALAAPQLIYGEGTTVSLNDLLTRVWNRFVDLAKLPKKYRKKLNENGFELLVRLGVPRRIAKLAVAHVPELAVFIIEKALPVGVIKIIGPLMRKFIK